MSTHNICFLGEIRKMSVLLGTKKCVNWRYVHVAWTRHHICKFEYKLVQHDGLMEWEKKIVSFCHYVDNKPFLPGICEVDSSVLEFGLVHWSKQGFQSQITNSIDLDETACYMLSHLDLHCLHRYWFWFDRLKGLWQINLSICAVWSGPVVILQGWWML